MCPGVFRSEDPLPLDALALVLLSAGLHVAWNTLVKMSRDKQAFLWLVHVPVLVLVLPLFLAAPRAPVPPLGWAMILASAVLHVLYAVSLGVAYAGGDLSLVYPLARSAPVFVPVWAVWWLGERPTPAGLTGVGLVIAGASLLALEPGRPARRLEPLAALRRPGVRWALAAALFISLYHVTDKVGVSVVDPLGFQYLMIASRFVIYSLAVVPWKGRALAAEARRHWRSLVAAGLLQFLAYQLVLYAMTRAPVSYVAAVRQTSVLIAVVTGGVVLKEGGLAVRISAAAAIAAGVALIGLLG